MTAPVHGGSISPTGDPPLVTGAGHGPTRGGVWEEVRGGLDASTGPAVEIAWLRGEGGGGSVVDPATVVPPGLVDGGASLVGPSVDGQTPGSSNRNKAERLSRSGDAGPPGRLIPPARPQRPRPQLDARRW